MVELDCFPHVFAVATTSDERFGNNPPQLTVLDKLHYDWREKCWDGLLY